MDFYAETGPMALTTRLRGLVERLSDDATQSAAYYERGLPQRWMPVHFVLARHEPLTTGELARIIGHSHAAVSQVVREMVKAGLVEKRKSPDDGRANAISLSAQGRAALADAQAQCQDVGSAARALLAECSQDLWQAIAEVHAALDRASLTERVAAARRQRLLPSLAIVDFEDRHADAFYHLNAAWIARHFTLEPIDEEMLRTPRARFLDPGGHILIAELDGEPVGTVGLIPMGDGRMELSKMCVAERARALGIGLRLGQAALDWARAAGASAVYLESNRAGAATAVRLYRRLGFEEVDGGPSPYARCDIQMERRL